MPCAGEGGATRPCFEREAPRQALCRLCSDRRQKLARGGWRWTVNLRHLLVAYGAADISVFGHGKEPQARFDGALLCPVFAKLIYTEPTGRTALAVDIDHGLPPSRSVVFPASDPRHPGFVRGAKQHGSLSAGQRGERSAKRRRATSQPRARPSLCRQTVPVKSALRSARPVERCTPSMPEIAHQQKTRRRRAPHAARQRIWSPVRR